MKESNDNSKNLKENIENKMKNVNKKFDINFKKEEIKDLCNNVLEEKIILDENILNIILKEDPKKYYNCANIILDSHESFRFIIKDIFEMNKISCYRLLLKDINKLEKVKKVKIILNEKSNYIIKNTKKDCIKILDKIVEHSLINKIKDEIEYFSKDEIINKCIKNISIILEKRYDKLLNTEDLLKIIKHVTDIRNYIYTPDVYKNNHKLIIIGDYKDKMFLKNKDNCYYKLLHCDNIKKLYSREENKNNIELNNIGLINLNLQRKYGRIGDFEYTDFDSDGFNSFINNEKNSIYTSISLVKIKSKEELYNILEKLYKINKNICVKLLKNKDNRLNIDIKDYGKSSVIQREWLSDCYEKLRRYDTQYSEINNYKRSIKLTCCGLFDNKMIRENAINRLNLIKKLQIDWCDNNVNYNVYYNKEEFSDIKIWLLENYNMYIKSIYFVEKK